MSSLTRRWPAGSRYWYLREMARVDGEPKMVSERYLGSAAEIEALSMPGRPRYARTGPAISASVTWPRHGGVLERLKVISVIDSLARPAGEAEASAAGAGTAGAWQTAEAEQSRAQATRSGQAGARPGCSG